MHRWSHISLLVKARDPHSTDFCIPAFSSIPEGLNAASNTPTGFDYGHLDRDNKQTIADNKFCKAYKFYTFVTKCDQVGGKEELSR